MRKMFFHSLTSSFFPLHADGQIALRFRSFDSTANAIHASQMQFGLMAKYADRASISRHTPVKIRMTYDCSSPMSRPIYYTSD